eukprot:m.31273 g.31273  ORF g.31273 m.31273 type:complete len:181 (-) comp16430_c0_seq2:13-555(-)
MSGLRSKANSPTSSLQVLHHPPLLFGIVEAGLYRTDIPKLDSFPYLRELKLKTALILTPEKPLKEIVEFFKEAGIDLVHLGLTAAEPTNWKPVSEELVKESLDLLLNPAVRPAIIMCPSGIHQTGVVVGCLRRLQNWSVSACLHEYRMFAGSKAREMAEQFIELFDPDLIAMDAAQLTNE